MANLMKRVAEMVGVTYNKHFIAIDTEGGEHILKISDNGLERYVPSTRRYADGSMYLQKLLLGNLAIKFVEGDNNG